MAFQPTRSGRSEIRMYLGLTTVQKSRKSTQSTKTIGKPSPAKENTQYVEGFRQGASVPSKKITAAITFRNTKNRLAKLL
jgi:hypothetical protein